MSTTTAVPTFNKGDKERPSGFSRARHGSVTYRMAWFAEIGLFLLATLVAFFNVSSVWHQGYRLQGFLMAGVWLIIAVIELSIIPLAGALRICGWRDKPFSLLGVIAVTGLSAWTVYESQEFTSYFMTKPARDAVIQIEKLRQDLATKRKVLDNAARQHEVGTNSLAQLTQGTTARLATLDSDYQQQADTRRREHEQRLKGLEAGLPKPTALDQSAQESIRALQEKIRRVESDRDSEIAALARKNQDEQAATTAGLEVRRTALQTQRKDLQSDVDKLRQAMKAEMEAVTGAFKETKRAPIRDRYQAQIDKVTARMNTVDDEIRQCSAVPTARPSTEADDIRAKAAAAIADLDRQVERVRAEAKNSLSTHERKHEQETARVRAEVARLEAAYQKNVEQERAKFEGEVESAKSSFGAQRMALTKSSLSDAELQKKLADGHSEVEGLETSITTIEAETDAKMEPVLYYRIAKWFHKGSGLPNREAYLRAQLYLFAPGGVLLSLVAVILAYVGTGLRDDQNRPQQAAEDVTAKERRLREQHRHDLQAMEDRLKKQEGKHRAKIIALEGRVTDLGEKVVESKLGMAETVERIPQAIVLQPPAYAHFGPGPAGWVSSNPATNGHPILATPHVIPNGHSPFSPIREVGHE